MNIPVEAKGLGLTINAKPIINSINLAVSPGTVTGIIGANGAGKTTLMKLLAGILPIQQGTISLNGKAIGQWSDNELARFRSWLPQQSPLHWSQTVEQVIALGCLPFDKISISSKEKSDAIDEVLDLCRIAPLRARVAGTLSQGELALVGLARALVTGPSLLMLDEPAAALDPHHQLRVMELIAQKQNTGLTTLVIMHDLMLAARYCDALLLMKNGRCLVQGSPTEVLTPENLQACYGLEASLIEGRFGVIPEFSLESMPNG